MKKGCNVCLKATLGGFAIAFAGFAVMIHGWPTNFFSTTTASWVQAIGSIVAIGFSAWLGKTQAQTALKIHTRGVEQRNKELQDELDRQRESEEIKSRQRKESGLAEAAVYKVLVNRLQYSLMGMHQDLEKTILQVREAKKNLDAAKSRPKTNPREPWHPVPAEDNLAQLQREYEQRLCKLLEFVDPLEHCIALLSQLPREQIRDGEASLADALTAAINNIQRAILSIENFDTDSFAAISVSRAEKNLSAFISTLRKHLELDELE